MAVNTFVLETNPSRVERHAILLNALREHFGNPEIDIEYNPKGKPFLVGADKHISVTNTSGIMVCAVSDTPVGIDGEYLAGTVDGENKTDYTAIAERFFTEEEADFVRYGDGDPIRFLKIWVRKEAYSKYTGKGLADFQNFSVNDSERFYGRINGVPIKKLNLEFPGSADYLFVIAGEYNEEEGQ